MSLATRIPENIDTFNTLLFSERRRLAGLCAHLTGRPDVAEELAQETLVIAWQNRHKLTHPEGYRRWLSAIARKVCCRWYREQGRSVMHFSDLEATHRVEPQVRADEMMHLLERHELIALLEKALALLPPETRSVLMAHYVDEIPHAEIAAHLGTSVGAVRVQTHRGKLALRKVLTTTLSEESAAYGLLPEQCVEWRGTTLWCPYCGQNRLLAQSLQATGSLSLQCPHCSRERPNFTHSVLPKLFAGTNSYRIALKRLLNWANSYYRDDFGCGRTQCVYCERLTPLLLKPDRLRGRIVDASCKNCGAINSADLRFVFLSLPSARQFWKEQTRICIEPIRQVSIGGGMAFQTCLHSLSGTAKLELLLACASLEDLSNSATLSSHPRK